MRLGFSHQSSGSWVSSGWYLDAITLVRKVPELAGDFESGRKWPTLDIKLWKEETALVQLTEDGKWGLLYAGPGGTLVPIGSQVHGPRAVFPNHAAARMQFRLLGPALQLGREAVASPVVELLHVLHHDCHRQHQ